MFQASLLSKTGDLVFFNFDGGEIDYVAIVEKINSNGAIGVVEGNSALRNVKRTDYNTNVIVAIEIHALCILEK